MRRINNLLLGIDVGTSSCKLAIFLENGKILAQASRNYDVYYPKPGYCEQDPNTWWLQIVECIKELGQKADLKSISAIGIDGQSWSAIPIDKEQNVLHNTPIWFDTRSSEICKNVKKTFGEHAFFEISGNPFEASYTLPKIIWFKENLPEIYDKTDKILQSNAFIAMKLTGNITHDYSQGYGLQCYDIHKKSWDFNVMKELKLRSDILPELCDCHEIVGRVTNQVAALTGLAEGTPVVAGGLDAACGTLGAGVISSGQTQEQGGQAGGMSICTDSPISHKSLILSNHVVSGKYLLQGGTTGGGGVINWFEKNFLDHERNVSPSTGISALVSMDKSASLIPVGSDGLIFLPYMAGERSPIWNPHAKGMYFGIDFSKTKAHFARASMEGVAFSLLHNLEVAHNAGAAVNTLHAVGGAANSKLWTQIKADLVGKEISVPYSDSATTLGACILAGVGTGLYKDFEDAVKKTVKITKTYTPNMENHEKYRKIFPKYLELYESTKHLMTK